MTPKCNLSYRHASLKKKKKNFGPLLIENGTFQILYTNTRKIWS